MVWMLQRPRKKQIVVLGGGTGTYTVLTGLKHSEAMQREVINLTAVITTADNGSSSGILRDELGVLPQGDLRQAVLALAREDDAALRERFNRRLGDKSLEGHPVGNLFMASLEALLGDPLEMIREASRIFKVCGRIIPVTTKATDLSVRLEDGSLIKGEHAIDTASGSRSPIRDCFLNGSVEANPDALEAIKGADMVVMGPGDLFTSVIPVLLVPGVTQALAEAKAVTYVVNLMTKRGQTDGFAASRFRSTVQAYADPAKIHNVIVNTEAVSDDILKQYEKEGEFLVVDDLVRQPLQKIVRAPLIANGVIQPVQGDRLRRSLIRHDPHELARAILALIREYS